MRRAWWTGPMILVSLAVGCAGDDARGIDGSTDPIVRGERVYERSCASCHGDDLAGTPAGTSMLSEAYAPTSLTDDEIRSAVRDGAPQRLGNAGPMPAVGAVRGDDLEAVIAFVRDRQRAAGLGGG